MQKGSSSSLRVRKRSTRSGALFGASIGAGAAAHAVQQGGADFLLVANVGRLRMMGAPSCACHLPLRDCNKLVADYARGEILAAAGDVPTFLGVAACDPNIDLREYLALVREWGFHGVSNFPTFSQMIGPYRELLEASGLGFRREIEMLTIAKAMGFPILGYGGAEREVSQLVELGADLICVQFDPQLGLTAESSLADLEIAANFARPLISYIRRHSPDTLCLCGGAAISNPERMHRLTKLLDADGYIGGSTIDQLPLEASIEDKVAEFKSVAALERKSQDAERGARELGRVFRLSTQSQDVRDLFARISRAARMGSHLMITGEAGTGKTSTASSVHRLGRRRSKPLLKLVCETNDPSIEMQLFGCAAGTDGLAKARIGVVSLASGATLLIERLENVPLLLQSRLLLVMEESCFRSRGEPTDQFADPRLIFTSRLTLQELRERGLIAHELYLKLRPVAFHLPPLRDRIEDIPILVNQILLTIQHTINPEITAIEHAAIRYLQRQSWPGNLRDLGAALEGAAQVSRSTRIQLADLRSTSSAPPTPTTEREWIIDALRRHKFRRGITADFLGISRKTLYNKLKLYRIRSR